MVNKQKELAAWNAGFVDGDGCIANQIQTTDGANSNDFRTTPAVHITNSYHSGLLDAEGSLEMRIMDKGDSYSLSPRCSIRQRQTDCPIVSKLTEFAESIDVEYSLTHREYDGENSTDQFCFSIIGVNDVDKYLRSLEPHLVVKKEQAQIMLEDILPKLSRGEHKNRRGFLRVMKHVDRMNNLKGGQRGKYTLQYFEDLWGMSLE